MIQGNYTALTSPLRSIRAKVELYKGSTLVSTYYHSDNLAGIDIDRLGDESKFFGFGVSQKATIKLNDPARQLNIDAANSFKVYFSADADFICNHPIFYVDEVKRDENTNQLTITGYDLLNKASNSNISEALAQISPTSYIDLLSLQSLLAQELDSSLYVTNINGVSNLDLFYSKEQLNLEGTETFRDVFNYIAEITQSVYYLNGDNRLIFNALKVSGDPVLTISKSDYVKLQSKTQCKLTTITNTTQLGEALTATTGEEGATQYFRDNQLLELREDVATILDNAIAKRGGFTIHQFDCSWRGNYFLEIGDKIALITKDDQTIYSYIFNDSISYDGGLDEKTSWNYAGSDEETANNPTSLGEAIKQTFAKVDKVNKQIDIVASEASSSAEDIAALQINTNSISASVTQLETQTNEAIDNTRDEITQLTNKVNAQMTAEQVRIEIQSELANGVTKVTTSTGVTVDEEGLTVDKGGSPMKTTISDNGVQVFRDSTPRLTANEAGVNATNLHATTYLIVGDNSRFENYGYNRTGCFWIGGSN